MRTSRKHLADGGRAWGRDFTSGVLGDFLATRGRGHGCGKGGGGAGSAMRPINLTAE